MSNPNIAIIGLGFGAEFIPIYQRHPQANMYGICQRTEASLNEVGDKYGIDKFLIGTDYPHPDAHMNVAQTVETLSSISAEAYEAMTWKNAARLFGLEDRSGVSRAAE